MSLSQVLFGRDAYPVRLMQRGRERELLEYRKSQTIPGNVFTNGKFDSDRVARILAAMELKQKFRGYLQAANVIGVVELFADDGSFTPERRDWNREGLTNVVVDSNFTTPLHEAASIGSVGFVKVLVVAGAKPRREKYVSMCSLFRMARTTEPELDFKKGLGQINILDSSFDVLVIPEIPDSVLWHGFHLSYMDMFS